jgi:hypothetical protein
MSSELTHGNYPVRVDCCLAVTNGRRASPGRSRLVRPALLFTWDFPAVFFLTAQFLAELGIGAVNPGFYNGTWGGSGSIATAVNPATGEAIATVQQATTEEYEACVSAMIAAQEAWQLVRGLLSLSVVEPWSQRRCHVVIEYCACATGGVHCQLCVGYRNRGRLLPPSAARSCVRSATRCVQSATPWAR